MKNALPLLLALALASPAWAGDSLSGEFRGRPYTFRFDRDFHWIKGNWGNLPYDLTADPVFNELQGTLAGSPIHLKLDAGFHEAKGETPCGGVALKYDVLRREIRGTYCGERLDLQLENSFEVMPRYRDLIYSSFLQAFPSPAQGPVFGFVDSRVRF